MSPELREFVLSLPVDVRKELCRVKCDACYVVWTANTGWDFLRMTPDQSPLYASAVEAPSATVMAVVPVSPIAIALHAAKLSRRDGTHVVAVSVHPCYDFASSTAYTASNPSPRHKPDVQVNYEDMTDDDTAKDPTGHRAAIALLQKVMAEVTP